MTKTRLVRHQFLNRHRQTIDQFHRAYYSTDVQSDTFWMGRHIVKAPTDVWAVQEILWETKPDLLIETGTYHGGSALFYAHLFDLIGHGDVVSVDIVYDPEFDYPNHPRLEFLLGASSIDPAVVEQVAKRADGKRCMVILDSNHQCDHVLQELRAYHGFVAPGCYLVVEDTNRHGYAMNAPPLEVGPAEAVRAWEPTKHGFEIDHSREKFLLTFHPSGWLRKVE